MNQEIVNLMMEIASEAGRIHEAHKVLEKYLYQGSGDKRKLIKVYVSDISQTRDAMKYASDSILSRLTKLNKLLNPEEKEINER